MGQELGLVKKGRTRFDAIRSRIGLLGGQLSELVLADRPVDDGIRWVEELNWALDAIFEDVLDAAHRGGPEALLDRAHELVRMKQRSFRLLQRYVDQATGGMVLVPVERQIRNELQHARTLLAEAGRVRDTVLAG